MEIKYSGNNNGVTFIKLKVGTQNYTIHGFSRAGLRTCIMIDELNLVLDYGYSDDKAFSFDNKVISHGHCDHIGSLHIDHCARKFNKIEKDKLLIMPSQCMKPFKIISSAISEMNRGKPGNNIQIFDNLQKTILKSSEECLNNYEHLIGNKSITDNVIKAIEMDHKIKSYGYIVYRKTKKLKKEFIDLSKEEIIKIRKEIPELSLTEIFYNPLIAYTGDTTINGVLRNKELLSVPLLIMECTGFSDEEIDECNTGKHIHWNDIVNNSEAFKNDKIILFHFSQKYRDLSQIFEIINSSKINQELLDKIIFFY
jgi:ribonuclease Z